MATSEYQYRVLTDSNTFGDSTHALDAFTTRLVLNNLNHGADVFAQVRVALGGTTPSLISKNGYLTSRAPSVIDTPYSVICVSFPISVRASGKSYKMRVRIGGASPGGPGASATFHAVLSPGRDASAAVLSETDASYHTTPTVSTTPVWLTGASNGTFHATLMEMSAAQVSRCWTEFPTFTEDGGDVATVTVPWVTLSIFAETSSLASTPRLYNVYAAEVIGT